MLLQPRIWEVLEYFVGECAGVLRRRMPARTVFGVLAIFLGCVLLGAEAFVARDPTLLVIVAALVATAWAVRYRGLRLALAAAARRLKRLNRPSRRAGFVRAGEFVDAGANAGVERSPLPLRAQALRRFGRYHQVNEAANVVTGVEHIARQDERTPGLPAR